MLQSRETRLLITSRRTTCFTAYYTMAVYPGRFETRKTRDSYSLALATRLERLGELSAQEEADKEARDSGTSCPKDSHNPLGRGCGCAASRRRIVSRT